MTDPDLFLFVSHVSGDQSVALAIVDELEAIRRRDHGATLDELARSYNVGRATISRLHPLCSNV
jgi:predicted DNA-binding protein (UPF0251 family)